MSITPEQIEARARQIINANAAKHGIDPDSCTTAQREDAKHAAIEQLEYESNPHVQALEAEREKTRLLEAQLAALRSRGPVAPPSGKAPFNAAQVRGRLGASFYQMSQSQKILAAGVDPSTVNVHELKKLFGRGADTAMALDRSRQNPSDYARLRELARLLDLDGR
jgi:hypothetical protein